MGRKSQLLARGLHASGIASALRLARAWKGAVALAYHRIGDGASSVFDRGLWSATADAFEAQVRFLKTNFDVIGPDDLKAVAATRRGRYVLVTFDDGYRDNYELAFAVLKSHRIGGTFFVSTGFLDRPRLPWWDEIAWMVRSSARGGIEAGGWLDSPVPFDQPDRERAIRRLLSTYKSLPGGSTEDFLAFVARATGSGRYSGDVSQLWMTWAMAREMRAAGMWFGGHTVNHPILSRLAAEQQREEITGCLNRLQSELGGPVRSFSYPVGGRDAFNADTRRCLRDAGVEVAFSYYGGFQSFAGAWDCYDLPRVRVETELGQAEFQAVMSFPQAFA